MSEFFPAVDVVLVHEGEKIYADTKTNEFSRYGITLKFLAGILPSADKDDVLHLTKGQSITIYEMYIWKPGGFAGIRDQRIANAVFDITVNMGPGGWVNQAPKPEDVSSIRILKDGGITLLQKAHNQLSAFRSDQITIDGIMGEKTLAAVNRWKPTDGLLDLYIAHVKFRYQSIAAANPALARDLGGWLARADSLLIHIN